MQRALREQLKEGEFVAAATPIVTQNVHLVYTNLGRVFSVVRSAHGDRPKYYIREEETTT